MTAQAVQATLVRTALNGTGRIAPRLAARWSLAFWNPGIRVRLKPAEEPVMRGAARRWVEVDGVRTAVHHWGDGARPVLLMHGWASRASRFAPLVEALTERGYSPVAFDAPGHGESGGRGSSILQYRALARRLQAEHGRFAAVVGHSVGGLSAFFALRGQVAADRLVSLASPAEFGYVVERFRARLGMAERLAPPLREAVERRLFPGERDIWRRFSAIHRPGELPLPLLVVHDEDDDMVERSQAALLADAYAPQADVLITRGLGHRGILAAPHVVEAVLDFTAATEPAAHEAP
ncbi:alpha/beta fold hydrolase [Streptomyces radicis]|uniref:Alpha/beta fold hydrolase n=1 Tax=Streptomyces radicis TaxID=1750517 RepID=A0A3A9VRL6_9ACTN|nr:alpha/beta fold hydrolase [Streptomyces radicis]RKN03192.1 alpha/beta fold hydrolase [Streptomyces radicis]RKN13083.1 alpha/beta fold hydrolase [Streptomyces radicis]